MFKTNINPAKDVYRINTFVLVYENPLPLGGGSSSEIDHIVQNLFEKFLKKLVDKKHIVR